MKDYENRKPQISEREIERKYSKLIIKDAEPNRTNCYTCNTCGHIIKTIDRHEGVTPFMIACDVCKNRSISSMYRNTHPDLEPIYEWVVPTIKEIKKYKKNVGMLDHIFNGGLELKRIL